EEKTMGTISNASVPAGSTLQLNFVKTESGKALSAFTIAIRYSIDAPKSATTPLDDNVIRIRNDIGTDPVMGAKITDRDFLILKEFDAEKFRIDINGMLHGTSADRYHYDVINLGDLVSTNTKKAPILRCDVATRIENIWIGVDTTIAPDSNEHHWQLIFTDATNVLA
ncbi:unnamed protein product, partial [marine sediment metagenome]